MNYLIRLAKEEDSKELAKLKHSIWETTYRGIYADEKIDNFDYKKSEDKFIDMVKNPNVKIYVVEDNDILVGYMEYGKPYRPYLDYKNEIGLLYIKKKYQGMGIGKELFKLAYNRMKEKGITEFFISCNKYNISAQKFYKKMGGLIIEVDEDNEDKAIPQVYFLYIIR